MEQRSGVSLVEVVVLLLVVALLVTLRVWVPSATASVRTDAARIASLVRDMRIRAIVSGRSTTVSGEECAPPATRAVTSLVRSTVVMPRRGLQFTPEGLPQNCAGGLGNATIPLVFHGQQAAVIVSSLGRVRWEMR
jgi:hypothetical protein